MFSFASKLQNMQVDSVQSWIESQMMHGRYIFTRKEVESIGLSLTVNSLNVSLSRCVKRGIVMSPWQNFYVAIPMEFRLKGEVPPSFYIDSLMRYLQRDYYVSLLSAAAFHGAGHQRAMIFQVTANGSPLRSGIKNGTRLDFTLCQQSPQSYTMKVKVTTGYMNVASPELTALDLVAHEDKVGGLSRVAEVIAELSDRMSWEESKRGLLGYFSAATIQRLGYLLDRIDEHPLANNLLALSVQAQKVFRKVSLKKAKPTDDSMEMDSKWKLILNQTIEMDEL
jgi:predicted transcriptional regulator of viral defense system